ncbi:hypothetical protein WEN_01350 [Mycoplasma wenyonii str. Massachusetts]|uniref:Uncharacterized protein n=1 Tax=Mycoplasma wenyonii (strain Massachusetts) TaxID=1197325 RepID=I6YLA8_MYCWM|nr:hypothetical protein [Mycoplasma wenyonii]AFN65069.1 hypothetical protein WEN_01350 [Mycoplasma wenyonii str. Massachusetts]
MGLEQEKIIAFELDFFQLKQDYSEQELTKLFSLFKELSIYNNLFLFTHNSLELASSCIREQKLNLGYLISNSGSCVYNLTTTKREKEHFLERRALELISRFGFFNNQIFVIHCSNNSFIFGLDYLAPKRKKRYSNLTQLNSLPEIKEVLEGNSVYSLEVWFEESNSSLRSAKIQDFLNKLLEFQLELNYLVIDPTIYLFPKNNSNYQVLREILECSEKEIKSNLIYSSLATPNFELAKHSHFWFSFSEFSELISRELPESQVVFFDKNSKTWVEWWEEHNYLWKENLFKLDWISRKIKKTEIVREEGKDYCFELDLSNGLLQSRAINAKLNTWGKIQKKIFGESKESLVTLFLWPEQLNSLLAPKVLKINLN